MFARRFSPAYARRHQNNGESTVGSQTIFASVDPQTATRSYSASVDPVDVVVLIRPYAHQTITQAYYEPFKDRPNLKVLIGSLASRILFRTSPDSSPLVADGVEFIHSGKRYSVAARREVILCAGKLQVLSRHDHEPI